MFKRPPHLGFSADIRIVSVFPRNFTQWRVQSGIALAFDSRVDFPAVAKFLENRRNAP
jgi:hypothetical protein